MECGSAIKKEYDKYPTKTSGFIEKKERWLIKRNGPPFVDELKLILTKKGGRSDKQSNESFDLKTGKLVFTVPVIICVLIIRCNE